MEKNLNNINTDQVVICTWCPNRCIIGNLAFTGIPKDTSGTLVVFVPAKLIKGIPAREYCKLNFKPAA